MYITMKNKTHAYLFVTIFSHLAEKLKKKMHHFLTILIPLTLTGVPIIFGNSDFSSKENN